MNASREQQLEDVLRAADRPGNRGVGGAVVTVTSQSKNEAALDLARNVAGLDDRFFLSADLEYIRATVREWREQARKALEYQP